MNEMVDRIARAMHNEINPDDDYDKFVANNQNPQRYARMARAAIEAMREPTDEMKACDEVHWGYSCHVCGGLAEGWYKMFDAALGKVDA